MCAYELKRGPLQRVVRRNKPRRLFVSMVNLEWRNANDFDGR